MVTDVPDVYKAELRAAGEAALDDWLEKMGPDGDAILAEYRARITAF